MSKPKLGSGERFAHLENQLAGKGAHDPGALAAYIGREKYGAKKMNQLAEHGREQHFDEGGKVHPMHDQDAKLAVLQQIIDAMTGHMLNGAMARKKPAAVEVQMTAASPLEKVAEAASGDKGQDKDDLDDDSAKSLLDLYGKDDDEKDEDDDALKAALSK